MRYHFVCHSDDRITGEYAYDTKEQAERAMADMLRWQKDVNGRLLETFEARLRASLFDIDDSEPDWIGPRLERETYSVHECKETECYACWEAGLIIGWGGLC